MKKGGKYNFRQIEEFANKYRFVLSDVNGTDALGENFLVLDNQDGIIISFVLVGWENYGIYECIYHNNDCTMTLAEILKRDEPDLVTELDLGETSVFEVDGSMKPKTKIGQRILNILEEQFRSRKMIYCSVIPPEKKYSGEKKYVYGGYHEVTGYHYTVISMHPEDSNNFHIIY